MELLRRGLYGVGFTNTRRILLLLRHLRRYDRARRLLCLPGDNEAFYSPARPSRIS